jgi:hypothetical protein
VSASYRIAENEWNLKGAPWRGAVGIEYTDDGKLAVPPLVCWFTRGSEELAALIVSLLNRDAALSEWIQIKSRSHDAKAIGNWLGIWLSP